MSKGIVMERHRTYSIVMTSDGGFHKVKPVKDAGIGTEVSYEVLVSKKKNIVYFQHHKPAKYIAIACVLILFVMPFYFLIGQSKTYAYVNLDINPSLEIELNKDLQVVSISPLNDDAETLVKQLSHYKDKKIEQVIEQIMNKSDTLGLTKSGKNVLVGVSYVDNKDTAILDTVDAYFSTHKTAWGIATFKVPKEIREHALEKDISMNKAMADSLDESADPAIKVTQTRVNDEEKELIHSFYTNSKANHQKSEENTPISKEINTNDSNDSTVSPQTDQSEKGKPDELGEREKKTSESRIDKKSGRSDKPAKVEKKEKPIEKKHKIQEKYKKHHERSNSHRNENRGKHGKNGHHENKSENRGNHGDHGRKDYGKHEKNANKESHGNHENHGNHGKNDNHGRGNNGHHNKHK